MSLSGPDPDHPIEEYIEAKRGNVSPAYMNTLELILGYYSDWLDETGRDVEEVSPTEVQDFVDWLRAETGNSSDGSIDDLLTRISSMYNYWARRSVVEGDPVGLAREESLLDLNPTPTDYPFIPLKKFGDFLKSIDNPYHKALILFFAKTGARASEVANLDLRDINIQHGGVRDMYHELDIEMRGEVASKPDTVYIPSDIREGESYNGEVRSAGNKRSSDTYIPLDAEMKGTLCQMLAARPHSEREPEEPQPLFMKVQRQQERYTNNSILNYLSNEYERFFGEDHGLTTHFLRHYFTTHNRDKMGELYTRYFRGDAKGGDAINAYTHGDWVNIREKFIPNVYQFGVTPTVPPVPIN